MCFIKLILIFQPKQKLEQIMKETNASEDYFITVHHGQTYVIKHADQQTNTTA